MVPIGYSTGTLAEGRFRQGIAMLNGQQAEAIELSALREGELVPLIRELDALELDQFSYISFHAPSKLEHMTEAELADKLSAVHERKWPIVIHPDVLTDFDLWLPFGDILCIENMDSRKSTGRTADELAEIFECLPEASLCFDIAHAHQVDPTMNEAAEILTRFCPRIKQLHLSYVNSKSEHEPIRYELISALKRIEDLLPKNVPVILETPVSEQDTVAASIAKARELLCA